MSLFHYGTVIIKCADGRGLILGAIIKELIPRGGSSKKKCQKGGGKAINYFEKIRYYDQDEKENGVITIILTRKGGTNLF